MLFVRPEFPFNHVSLRRICSLPVHCLCIRDLKVILVGEGATLPYSTHSYTDRKVRAMGSTFSMAEVVATLVQYCRIRDLVEFETLKSKQFLKEGKLLKKNIFFDEKFFKR